MKILLYDTGDVREEWNEPIGIELLAANVLQEFEKQVTLDIKWFHFDGYDFDPLQYDVIGVSIHINGLDVFESIYKLCNECGFRGLLIAGNSIATFAYEQLLQKYPRLICCIGEGEESFREMIRSCMKGYPKLSDIPNLAYLEQGRVTITERRTCDMEVYLPPKRVFHQQLREHRGIARIEASRGCSWNQCSFCGAAHKYNAVGWRPIAVETILKQLVELSEAGLTTVYFCDEDFIGNDSERFDRLVKGIQEKMDNGEISADMRFFISIKPGDIVGETNMEIIKRFMHCGLQDLFVGLESGCENQLKRYHKCTNVKINALAVQRIRELEAQGISIDIGFIFFDYYMTPEDIEENIRFIEENGLYKLASSLIKPIRIQPFTKTFADTTEVHGNSFSMDDLMYHYHFADMRVEQVYAAYAELNLETIAHKIQSIYRREMSSAAEREGTTARLLRLRFLQFTAMKEIVRCYIRKEMEEVQLKSKLDEILANATGLLSGNA